MRALLLLLLALTTAGGCAHSSAQNGVASWYGPGLRGNQTASGEPLRFHRRRAAHRTLPFGSVVKVTRVDNGKSVRVVINDRGPFVPGRIIDLTKKPARRLGLLQDGHAKVQLQVVGCKKRYKRCS